MVFHGIVEGGLLKITDKESYQAHLSNLIGGVLVTVEKRGGRRSNKQNRYGHGEVFRTLSDVTGYEVSEIKELLMKMCGFVRMIHGVEVARSTASLDTAEWEELMRRGRTLGDELGVYVDLPQ